jgi:class 3 adenylate cyclase/tetratricopeptide (TPR) repeat protein
VDVCGKQVRCVRERGEGDRSVICSNCGTANEPGRKFCKECGTQLAITCPNCGAANAHDAKFCGDCGTGLAGAAVQVPAGGATAPPTGASRVGPSMPTSQPVAERRLVSVLFADLVGFTTLAEGRDPEETRDLLTRYFAVAREVIERYGGTVEKFIGDAVMAVWGAPVAREDDAERSVRAGLELVDAVKALGPGIQARAGVLTGEAAVTLGATGEGMVAGDLVNTASRLQSVAPPGSVLVGEATERSANQAIAFEPAGEQTLKGKTAPVPAFRALRIIAEVGGKHRSEGLEAPFVGRDDEFRLLRDLFHSTKRDRRPRLVSVIGPGGIGKSRLAWEFLKYIDGLVEDTWWHSGRSPAYGQGITFWALGEMVRRRGGLLETDDEATTRQKVAETVARFVSDDGERRWVETALLALLGFGEPLPGGRDELFAAWRTFFERIAATGPTVLLFEDLQWADPGVLDFIDHVLDWTKALPIFVITLSRPDLLDRRPDWGAGRRNFVSLALDPLPAEAMQELLAGLVPGLDRRVADSIVARADGIPLYAVETVRMLLADGRLKEEGGSYRAVGELTSLAVPETLTALIAARLDAIEPSARSVLQDAAVLGQSFTVTGLAAITGREANQLEPVLRDLVRQELLDLNADPRSPERGQYGFVQALIREVAYNQLARPDRKVRHLAAARWFESLGEDQLAGALAQHYVDAYRNAPAGAEADALAAQARLALKGAAERAGALGSHGQALEFLRLWLEITEDPAEQAAVRERAGRAATDGADFETAQAYLEEAIASYRAQGDRLGIARATTALSTALHGQFRPLAAVGPLEAAVAETSDLETEPDVVRLIAELSRAYGNAQDPRGLAMADRALALAEPLELIGVITEALINRSLALIYAGRQQEPIAILRGVLPVAEAHGLVHSQLRALNNLSAGLFSEDPRASYEIGRAGVELARRLGDRGWLLSFLQGAVTGGTFLGEWAEADRALAEVEGVDLPPSFAVAFRSAAAGLQALRGDITAADASVTANATTRLGDGGDPRNRWWQRLDEAFVHAMAGRLEAAYEAGMDTALHGVADPVAPAAEWATRVALWLADAARARAALDAHLSLPDRGRFIATMRQSLRAGVVALEGDRDAAVAGYRESIRTLRDMDLPFNIGLTLLEFGTLVGPDEPEAAAAAAEAREIWTRLGSPPLLARLEAGLARWEGAAVRPTGPSAAVAAGVSAPAASTQ